MHSSRTDELMVDEVVPPNESTRRDLQNAQQSSRLILSIGLSFCVMIVVVLWHTYNESKSLLQRDTKVA